MIRSELIHTVTLRNPHLYQQDVEKVVGTILDDIANALAEGDRVELRGFGVFSVRHRPSRSGRNRAMEQQSSLRKSGRRSFVPAKRCRSV
ncbi:hypothetical protein DEA98_28865 (plasmid) [Brucella pseudogrignonensis]|nr:hypothetical protein [Brucella pseudogrignonensis]